MRVVAEGPLSHEQAAIDNKQEVECCQRDQELVKQALLPHGYDRGKREDVAQHSCKE